MDGLPRLLVLAGVGLATFGVLLWVTGRAGLGRLPGDFAIGSDNWRLYLPLATSALLSIVLTVALNIALRTWR
jgi:hypothetical protein